MGVELRPFHEVREGVDVLWQIPANPKGVLFFAHGGAGTPFAYWPPIDGKNYSGTTELQVATKEALKRGFAVIASKSEASGWEALEDIKNTVTILKTWTAEHGLEHLPISAWGNSAGGGYVTKLALEIKLYTIIVMISSGRAETIESAKPGEYPAVLFVPMIKDATLDKVKDNVKILREKGIPCDIEEAPPLDVHPHFLAEHIEDLAKEQSAKLHSLLVEHGIVGQDNKLIWLPSTKEIEPLLRKGLFLPTASDSQKDQDEEKLKEVKESGAKKTAGRPGGQGTGRGGSPGGPPGGGRGGGPGQIAGRGGSPAGGGPPAGGPPGDAPNLLADAVSNQLRVAEGKHTFTARHNKKVFDWMEGKGWPSVSPAF